MNLHEVTPLILTYNEAPNIERTLQPLGWAREIIVVDSGSTDDTLQLFAQHANVRVVQRAFDDHTSQWNFGLDLVDSPWVLTLDADYVVRRELVRELQALVPGADVVAYFARFRYLIFGKPLRATLYPERAVLFRSKSCRYVADGHTQTLRPAGESRRLAEKIDHDDRKPFERWLESQKAYTRLEANKLLSGDPRPLSWREPPTTVDRAGGPGGLFLHPFRQALPAGRLARLSLCAATHVCRDFALVGIARSQAANQADG